MEQDIKTLNDMVEIVKRRKWSIILPALGIFAVAALTALLLPPTYRSTSTILIEEQEIPREYVMTTVTSFAEERLQAINQRIMSSSRLMEVINRFKLYPDLQVRWTVEEIIEKMRKDIKFETISADVVDRRTGRPTAATIAFSVSYEGRRPDVVQQVANVLASLYLEENLRVREQQTTGASKFMEDEMKKVQTSLADLDARIAAFKAQNLNALPELVQLNLQTLERIDRDIDSFRDQLRTLKEKESALQSQLASIPKDTSDPDKERLKQLRAALVNLHTRYSDEYPDVIKTKEEIAELEKRLAGAVAERAAGNQPDNPAYINLSSQLAGTRSDISSVDRQLADMKRKRDMYQGRIARSPRVEEYYKALVTARTNTQAKYDDLMKKHMEANVASGMEKEQMGERFTLIDAARLPEKPVSPNVPAILLIGLILGVGAGVGTASLRESSDQSFRTTEALAAATGLPVLGGVPDIVVEADTAKVRERRIAVAIGVFVALVVAVAAFHFFVMDLDVLWARLSRRYGF
jgi:polysaccharide biosynthesis transport protein